MLSVYSVYDNPEELPGYQDWPKIKMFYKFLESPIRYTPRAEADVKTFEQNKDWFSKTPERVYKYAKFFINRSSSFSHIRWEEAEHVLLSSPKYTGLYAIEVIGYKGWPEAEHIIQQEENIWDLYKQIVYGE